MSGPFRVERMSTLRGSVEFDWVLLGPDDLIWHQAQAAHPLRLLAQELNRAYALGYDTAQRGRESALGKTWNPRFAVF